MQKGCYVIHKASLEKALLVSWEMLVLGPASALQFKFIRNTFVVKQVTFITCSKEE